MAWLVTGGAGYIGSHVVRAFQDAEIEPIVYDNLSSGIASFVPTDVAFIHGDLLDRELLAKTFAENDITGVVHIAGFKFAGVSVERPLHTYRQNVQAMVELLEAMEVGGVDKIVFSSSAAVFGTPGADVVTVTEADAKRPESPYGESKLIGEWLLADVARSRPLAHTSLRYFNVVGSGSPDLYDVSAHNLFPIVFRMLADGTTPRINGDDYDTPDGTAVRDYIHVADLAHSHVDAAKKLENGEALEPAYNLGSGHGSSVREIMAAMAEATGIGFEPEIAPRRAGDPDRIVASGELAARDLDWRMRHTLSDMVLSGWEAYSAARRAGATA